MYKYDAKRICYRIESLQVSHNSCGTKSLQIYHHCFSSGPRKRSIRTRSSFLRAEGRSGSKKKKKKREEDTERKDQHKLAEIFSDESVEKPIRQEDSWAWTWESSRPSESQNPATKTSGCKKNFAPLPLPSSFFSLLLLHVTYLLSYDEKLFYL